MAWHGENEDFQLTTSTAGSSASAGLRRTLIVSVIWSVPRVDGVNRQAPTSASRSASAVCSADRFLK